MNEPGGLSPAKAPEHRPPAAGPVMVRAEGLTRRFGSLTAVDNLTFSVEPGEMLGLIGPDGAGKTTTLRMVLGLLAPDAGRIETCSLDPVRRRSRLSREVGYLSQRFSLYGDLSCDENIAFFAEIYGVRDWKPRRDELLAMLRLAPFRGRLAERLSGGMKQKLALACTLIHTPKLLVLDEPTTGVDPVSRREFWRILSSLQRSGLTLLLTTPYLDEAERCQRVALMHHGQLLLLDRPEALRQGGRARMVELLARPKRQVGEWLRRRPEVREIEVFGERFHVGLAEERTPEPAEDAAAAAAILCRDLRAAGMEVESARAITPSLEDRFIEQIRRRDAAEEARPAGPKTAATTQTAGTAATGSSGKAGPRSRSDQ